MKKADPSGPKGGRRRKAGAPEPAAAQGALGDAAPAAAAPPALAVAPAPSALAEPPPAAAPRDPLADFFVSTTEHELVAQSFGLDGPAPTVALRDMLELLGFWVADEEYALPIVDIQEIIKVPLITELPRAHPVVLGIISLRGTIVPVVDLRRVLKLEERAVTRQARILVVRAEEDPVGLLVDRVTSVVRFEADKIEATPRTMQRQTSELVRGVGRVGNRLIIVLDVKAVMGVMDNAA